MNVNTPQGTGALTLDQGVAAVKAKLAETGATVEDTAIIHPDNPDEEDEFGGEVAEELPAEDETDTDEPTDEPEVSETGFADDNAKTQLPDGSTVTIGEMRQGHLRHADYTRKTQALSAEKESLMAQHNAVMQQVSGMYQQLASLQERPPTPDQMMELSRTKTPEEFQQIQAYWQYKTTVMSQAQKAVEQQQAQAKQAQMAKAFEVLNSGEYEPAWKDQKALTAGLDTITSYVTENYPNVPPGLMGEIAFPEAIIVIDKARKWDELQKAKPKAALAVRGKPAPFKPGAKSTASPQSENLRLLDEAFRKNPSVDNATALHRAKAAARR